MLWFFTPYARDKKLLHAIDRCFSLVTDANDWVVLLDGDTAFLRNDFGHVIQRTIDSFPDTGLFTCYASRCHYNCQVPTGTDINSDSILYHKNVADHVSVIGQNKVLDLNCRIAGHLMVIQKKTWSSIRNEVFANAANKFILGVDTKICYAILEAGLPIRLIQELYIFHYLRLAEGFDYDDHLKA